MIVGFKVYQMNNGIQVTIYPVYLPTSTFTK